MDSQRHRSYRVVGLFAGIGGLESGLHSAGHSTEMLCEVWPAARAVLMQRFPDISVADDVRELESLPENADVVVAGFPCQDLSQAGRTAGIGGEQSGLVNASGIFISPDRNKNLADDAPRAVTMHKQPTAAERSINVVKGLPRRSGISETGYDGLAIVAIDMPNDGVTPVRLFTGPPAPPPGDIFNYETMVTRVANEYDAAFTRI